MKGRVRTLALISFIIGLVVFIWVVARAGPLELLTRLRALGWGFLLVLTISSIRYLARSLAWQRCMEPADRPVGLNALFRARLAGEALGDLTVGPLVAEPLRLVALGNRLPLASGMSWLAVENVAYAVSSCLMVAAGSVALLASFAVNESLRSAVLLSLVVAMLLVGISVMGVSQRWRLLSRAASLCGRFSKSIAGR